MAMSLGHNVTAYSRFHTRAGPAEPRPKAPTIAATWLGSLLQAPCRSELGGWETMLCKLQNIFQVPRPIFLLQIPGQTAETPDYVVDPEHAVRVAKGAVCPE